MKITEKGEEALRMPGAYKAEFLLCLTVAQLLTIDLRGRMTKGQAFVHILILILRHNFIFPT